MAEQLNIAEIPIGRQGLNGSSNLSVMEVGELAEANNISYEEGLIQKEPGAAKFNSSALESGADIIQGHWWEPEDGYAFDVVYVNGKIHADGSMDGSFDNGGGATPVLGSLSTSVTDVQFVEAGNETSSDSYKLFWFNGVNTHTFLTSSSGVLSSNTYTAKAADWSGSNWPSCGALHEDRVWAAGNVNHPHRVYYTITTDHSDWVSGGSMTVYPGEGGKITAMVSFKGFLIVFKKHGVYYVDTRDATIANWRTGVMSRSIGALNPSAVDIVDDDVIFVDQGGMIRSISTLREFGSIASKNLTDEHDMNRWIQRNISYSSLNTARVQYYPAKREVHIGLPITGSSNNNVRLVMDFAGGQIRWRTSDRDVPYSFWLRSVSGKEELGMGDGSGFVWRLDQSSRTADGGYVSRLETAPTDFKHLDQSFATRNKKGHYLELGVEPVGNWNIAVDIIWDNEFYETITYDMGGVGGALGSFVLGSDALGANKIKNIRHRVNGQGRRFALAIRHSGDSENFKISYAYLGFTLADHRIGVG